MSACAKNSDERARASSDERVPRAGPATRRARPADRRAASRTRPTCTARLEVDAKEIIARYPQRALGAAAAAAPGAVRGRLPHAGRNRVLRRAARPDRRRGHRGRHVLLHVSAHARPASTWSACARTRCARSWAATRFSRRCKDHLGIHAGETTDDGRVTLEHIECNAACDYAPVVMVNWEFFDNQTPSSARDLVDGLRAGEPTGPPAARRCAHSARPPESLRAARPAAGDDGPGRHPGRTAVAQALDMTAPDVRPRPRPTRYPTTRSAARRRRRTTRAGCRTGTTCPLSRQQRDADRLTQLTPVLSRFWDDPRTVDAGHLPPPRRLPALEQGAGDGARRCHRAREGFGAARSRRRGLPDRARSGRSSRRATPAPAPSRTTW